MVRWMPEAGRVDEIEPMLQVTRRHANLHVLGGVAEDYTFSTKLVVERQLPDAPRIYKRHPGEVDERPSPRSQAISQGVLEDTPASDVDLPGELDQFGLVVALCRYEHHRVAHHHATYVGHVAQEPRGLCLAALRRSSREEMTLPSGFCASLYQAIRARTTAPVDLSEGVME